MGFSGGTVVKSPPANLGDTRNTGFIPGSGRSPRVGNGNQLQDPCLENSMEKEAWLTIIHEVAKSWIVLLDAVVRDGLLRVFAGFADLHLGSFGRVGAGEALVDGAFFLFQVALDEREIEFFHFVFANHAGEVAECVPVECRDEHAGRFLVQAVRDGGLEVEPFAFTPFPEVFYEAFARAGAAAGLARESRGLVHDDIVFGLDDDIELACAPSCLFPDGGVLAPGGLAFCKPRFRRTPLVTRILCLAPRALSLVSRLSSLVRTIHRFEIFINADDVAFGEHLVRLADNPVDTDFLFTDDGEKYRKGFLREGLAKETVQPHVGKVTVDKSCNHLFRLGEIYRANIENAGECSNRACIIA